jgi:hypothetical protein
MSKLVKLSDTIHSIPLADFPFTGNLNKDVEAYVKYKNVPSHVQNLDDNVFVTLIFRLGFGQKMTVHTLTEGVIEKVKNTKIENVPNEVPLLMKNSFLFEAKNDNFLFDNIVSIGGFTFNNEICLLIGTKDNYYIQHHDASFDGRKIEDLNLVYNTNITYPESFIQLKERKDTFAFATILSLMLEADRTPLIIETKAEKKNNKTKNIKKNITETGWTNKRIYIDRNIQYKNNSKVYSELDKNGKQLKDVTVRGFLRKQHYGKDNAQTKWIYIESFDSTRWSNNKDINITVEIYEKNE